MAICPRPDQHVRCVRGGIAMGRKKKQFASRETCRNGAGEASNGGDQIDAMHATTCAQADEFEGAGAERPLDGCSASVASQFQPPKPAFDGGYDHHTGELPKRLTRAALRKLGLKPTTALQAIRNLCLYCRSGYPTEVRDCQCIHCPSWPFRMGRNPWSGASI